MFFFRTSIQFLLIPAVMADSVITVFRVWSRGTRDVERQTSGGVQSRAEQSSVERWSPNQEGKWAKDEEWVGWQLRGCEEEKKKTISEQVLIRSVNNHDIHQSVTLTTRFIVSSSGITHILFFLNSETLNKCFFVFF